MMTSKTNRNLSKRVFLSPPYLNGHEIHFIQKAIKSNYIAPLGPQVDAFEKALSEYTCRRYAVAVISGTAAIHLALKAAGVCSGNIVLASSLTFIGSVSPICFLDAEPIFIDSDEISWNMDPNILKEAIRDLDKKGRRPSAVLPTDIYGQCADYDAINNICNEFEIPLIIDSAESLGGMYKNKPAGSNGKAAILSFNGNKIITTSGGGALLTDEKPIAEYARKLSQQSREPFPHYEHNEIGYNYRMSNIVAAVGIGQMQDLEWRVDKKREIFNTYRYLLKGTPGIVFMPEAAYGRCSRWLSVCLINPEDFGADREAIRTALEAVNIESRPVWKPMHLQPIFKDVRVFGGSVSEKLFERGLCLPSGLDLSYADQERICDIMKRCRG
jgi:dTDP-4-amino-4,6-dideoxygalactose transaminase